MYSYILHAGGELPPLTSHSHVVGFLCLVSFVAELCTLTEVWEILLISNETKKAFLQLKKAWTSSLHFTKKYCYQSVLKGSVGDLITGSSVIYFQTKRKYPCIDQAIYLLSRAVYSLYQRRCGSVHSNKHCMSWFYSALNQIKRL